MDGTRYELDFERNKTMKWKFGPHCEVLSRLNHSRLARHKSQKIQSQSRKKERLGFFCSKGAKWSPFPVSFSMNTYNFDLSWSWLSFASPQKQVPISNSKIVTSCDTRVTQCTKLSENDNILDLTDNHLLQTWNNYSVEDCNRNSRKSLNLFSIFETQQIESPKKLRFQFSIAALSNTSDSPNEEDNWRPTGSSHQVWQGGPPCVRFDELL